MKHSAVTFTIRLVALLFVVHAGLPSVSLCQIQRDLDFELQRDLVIGDATGVAFGSLLKLAVDSERRIYVGDWMNRNVRIFSPAGELQETIGRSGQGPGEFTAVHQVTIGRGDSLYVYDASAFRVSVYAPGQRRTLAYTLRIPTSQELGYPYRVLVPPDPASGLLVAFRQQSAGVVRVHRVNRAGEVSTRPILEGRSPVPATRVTTAGGVATVSRTAPLFEREALLGLTPRGEVYYGWSEQINLAFYDLEGNLVRTFRAATRPIRVTAADIAHELEGASEARRQTLRGSAHPATKPAVHTVIVDDRSWIWTGRPTADPEISSWWVRPMLATRGKSARFSLPDNVDIQVVRDGYFYAVSEDAAGAPIVVRYAIKVK